MRIGTLRVNLMIRDARSLKDKRRIITSLKDQIRNRFNVSVAEIDSQDIWQRAVLGIATVSNDGKFVNRILSQVINFIRTFGWANLIDYDQEIL